MCGVLNMSSQHTPVTLVVRQFVNVFVWFNIWKYVFIYNNDRNKKFAVLDFYSYGILRFCWCLDAQNSPSSILQSDRFKACLHVTFASTFASASACACLIYQVNVAFDAQNGSRHAHADADANVTCKQSFNVQYKSHQLARDFKVWVSESLVKDIQCEWALRNGGTEVVGTAYVFLIRQ